MFKMGLIWTFVISVIFCIVYFSLGDTVIVNGVAMPTEETNVEIVILLAFGFFYLIGAYFTIKGLKGIINNKVTNKKGTDTYGVIIDIHGSGVSINGRSELEADILAITNGSQVEVFAETIGFNRYFYKRGDCLKLKHYNKDVNIVEKIQEADLPVNIFEILKRESGGLIGQPLYEEENEYDNIEYINEEEYKNKHFASSQNFFNDNPGDELYNNDELIINGKVYKRK